MANYQPAKLKPRTETPAAAPQSPEVPAVLPPPERPAAAPDEEQRRKDWKRQTVLNQLELESQESGFSRLARSKSFWYGIFGGLFLITMIALIAWVLRDIGWFGPR